MRLRKLFHAIVFAVITLLVAIPVLAEESLQEDSEEKLPTEIALTLIDIYTLSNSLPKALIDLQNDIDDTADVEELLLGLPDVIEQIGKLEWESTMAASDPTPSYHQLSSLDSRLAKIKHRLDQMNDPVASNMRSLELWYKQWAEKERSLKKLLGAIKGEEVLANSGQTIMELERIIQEGKKLIIDRIRPTLEVGSEIGHIQTRLYLLNDRIGDLVRDANVIDVQQTAPSLFSKTYYKQLDWRLLTRSWDNIRLFGRYQSQYFRQNMLAIGLSIVILLVLAVGIGLSKKKQDDTCRWYAFASRPFSTSLLICSATIAVLNHLPTSFNLPPGWDSLLTIPIVVAVAMLTDTVCAASWQSRLLRRSVLFFGIIHLLIVIDLPNSLLYLLIFYTSVAAFLFYLYLFLQRIRKERTKKLTWAVNLWGIIPILVIACGITGHDSLAIVILGTVLSVVFTSLMVWMMLYMLAGLVELFLLHFPLNLVSQNASTITNQLFPALLLGHVFLWLAIILVIFRTVPTVDGALAVISSAKFTLFSLSFTPVTLLVIITFCYLTILSSRGIRAFLEQDILQRYGVETGVQVSITRLVHYAVLTIGFFILLKMLGFGLHQLTILGGALGVGIGFGLQAIVNNFVSGLILLFERPVKVGDIIETTEGTGVIKELGLRATVVATFDDAEIVIPNSELITGSVTNWTLASKHVRVKVPVGVAYGTDIEQVKSILLSCAEANPLVLTTPKARAFFLSFGASSLDFELRVWIPDVQERSTVLSELNQDIEAEFSLAGIEVPFPQSDLHIRSVDQDVLHAAGEIRKR